MKAIVFGRSGFVGSYLADELTEAGHEVTIFDINSSSYLRKSQNFIQGDILDMRQGLLDCLDEIYDDNQSEGKA